ncbi:hypothetical protein NZ47_02670 [Anaerovibrio lipolyticus]|uniref:Uncharacterized protein n=1 Tax=Anaerovibrio lipolyticus TaxID=82374 RepID=A0A0B2JWU1_9FIRM|nr:hypothetical protein NZ47_02670 [Anaerovibrio lipolyticus]
MTAYDIYTQLLHLLPEIEPIGYITGTTGHIIYNNIFKFSVSSGFQHILEATSICIGSGLSLINKCMC